MTNGIEVDILGADTVLDSTDRSLVGLLDRLLDVGVVLRGTVFLGIADIDLVRVDLGLLLTSADRLAKEGRCEP